MTEPSNIFVTLDVQSGRHEKLNMFKTLLKTALVRRL